MGNVRKWLAKAEEMYPASRFVQEVSTRAADNNCEVAAVKIDDVYYAVVVDDHSKYRADTRVTLTDSLLENVMELIDRPDLNSWLVENPMFWSDEAGKLVPYSDSDEYGWPDSGQRVIVDERHNCIYLFEAGGRYLHLVTVFSTRTPNSYNPEEYPYLRFIVQKSARVRKVKRSGFVTSDLSQIPEVNLVAHKRNKRDQK